MRIMMMKKRRKKKRSDAFVVYSVNLRAFTHETFPKAF